EREQQSLQVLMGGSASPMTVANNRTPTMHDARSFVRTYGGNSHGEAPQSMTSAFGGDRYATTYGIGGAISSVSGMTTSVGNMTSSVSGMTSSVSGMTSSVSAMVNSVGGLGGSINQIGEQITDLSN